MGAPTTVVDTVGTYDVEVTAESITGLVMTAGAGVVTTVETGAA
jgi:hypothetical protein